MVVFLIGFMGSGKSFLNQQLSELAGIPAFDLDRMIEEKAGKSVASIFAEDGEDHFRMLEAETLRSILAGNLEQGKPGQPNAVVACGGGTPCFHGNMEWMNQAGLTVWLNPPTEVLVNRIREEKQKRPLVQKIQDDALTGYVEQLLEKRTAWYEKARLIVPNPNIEPQQLLNLILHA